MSISLIDVAKYFKGYPYQEDALFWLQQQIDPKVLDEFATMYRTVPESFGVIENTWSGIRLAGEKAGAKFPQCVAAQWALESAYGKHTSGKNNFFGIKGKGTSCTTWEDYGQGAVTVVDQFKDFDSIQDCVNELVNKWYKDYQGYKGVNRASTWAECCELLKYEGYATDPNYVSKLISIIEQND